MENKDIEKLEDVKESLAKSKRGNFALGCTVGILLLALLLSLGSLLRGGGSSSSSSNINKVNNVVQQVNNMYDEKNELESAKEELEKQIEELQFQLKYVEEENTQLQQQLEQLLAQLETLNQQISEKDAQIAELEKQLQKEKSNSVITVTYSDNNKTLKYVVLEKAGAIDSNLIPEVPAKAGYDGRWSNDGSNITADTIIYPVYTAKSYSINYLTTYNLGYHFDEYYLSADEKFSFRVNPYLNIAGIQYTYEVGNTGKFVFGGIEYSIEYDTQCELVSIYDAYRDVYPCESSGNEFYFYGFDNYTFYYNLETKVITCEAYNVPLKGNLLTFISEQYYVDLNNKKIVDLTNGKILCDKITGYLISGDELNVAIKADTLEVFNYYDTSTKLGTITNNQFAYAEYEGDDPVTYYFDFNNLFYYYTTEMDTSVNEGVELITSYTYGEDLIITGATGMTNSFVYDHYELKADKFEFTCENKLDITYVGDGAFIRQPLGDITVVVIWTEPRL